MKKLGIVSLCAVILFSSACSLFPSKENGGVLSVNTYAVNVTISYADDNTSTVPVIVDKGATAFDALQKVTTTNNMALDYSTSSYGVMINGMNGVQSDGAAGMYWLWYINDASASTAADQYEVKEGDTIKFVYGNGGF